ncbi:hypothetical protein BDV27DRAFT_124328 [Aspergillus caelatus]|uniref:Uncharacterized protein n=1 Tax=Aspergillus caelatus TaxID=61420 RepID=A0A5N7ABV1_9EURO|nr:uncharacterized protein BDV27DRAFT_124328 [Aspergillus caelatus]KAE8367133.1 hypothetical protein BDV27DRAFT_124328 [Aspergillus caelatus]
MEMDGVLGLNILEVASFSYLCLYMILCVVGLGSGFAAYSKPDNDTAWGLCF